MSVVCLSPGTNTTLEISSFHKIIRNLKWIIKVHQVILGQMYYIFVSGKECKHLELWNLLSIFKGFYFCFNFYPSVSVEPGNGAAHCCWRWGGILCSEYVRTPGNSWGSHTLVYFAEIRDKEKHSNKTNSYLTYR